MAPGAQPRAAESISAEEMPVPRFGRLKMGKYRRAAAADVRERATQRTEDQAAGSVRK